jgi:hypothetical protein
MTAFIEEMNNLHSGFSISIIRFKILGSGLDILYYTL